MLLSHTLLTFALVFVTATGSSPEVTASGTGRSASRLYKGNQQEDALGRLHLTFARCISCIGARTLKPIYFLSNAIKDKKSNGLIVGFRGYTACPDSFSGMAQQAWLDAGYEVMNPPLPKLSRDITICTIGNRIDSLPLTRQGYIDWADQHSNAIVVDESNRRRELDRNFAAGLGRILEVHWLASYVVNTASTKLYDGYIPMNAFYGFSSPDVDRLFERCTVDDLSIEECAEIFSRISCWHPALMLDLPLEPFFKLSKISSRKRCKISIRPSTTRRRSMLLSDAP
jgi:hypothetical protein